MTQPTGGSRAPRPEDLLSLLVPSEPRLSPDGGHAVLTVQTATRRADAYRRALWIVPTDGSAPARQLTIGARNDRAARFSPDGRTLAFVSDRRPLVEDEPERPEPRDDANQVHLLPLAGGEARRLTDLPGGVDAFEWSPDGRWLVAVSASEGATPEADRRARRLADPAPKDARKTSDYRYADRLGYQYNGRGFILERVAHLWLVEVATGEARRLTGGTAWDSEPAWSPDGREIAFTSARGRDADLRWSQDVHVVDVATGRVRAITGGPAQEFFAPAWLPDGRGIVLLGHRFPAMAGSRNDIWRFAADGSEAGPRGGTNVSGRHDLMPGSSMNSDVTIGEGARLVPAPDGRSVLFSAPIEGAYELWRIGLDGGELERLTNGRHYVSGWSAGADGSVAYVRSAPTELPDLWWRGADGTTRRLTAFDDAVLRDLRLVAPETRWLEVDGRRVQGWYLPPASTSTAGAPAQDRRPAPLVVEIHGGPHTLYGWSPSWEFQVLAGAGIGVWYSNPRGSEGYGQDFNAGNFKDWGDGPMRDVLAGVDALVADGFADPERLGVTGGSYGGYLTNWIVAKDQRFRAAMTCRCVSDLRVLMLTGDISGGDFGLYEFGARPWEDEALYRELSPITWADGVRTPLLIQHAENDIRCTIGQAEALFTFLRSKKRPVRLMRVPGETHELTRSGTPFRRVENLVQVRDWFRHFLVAGKRTLPPLPRERAIR